MIYHVVFLHIDHENQETSPSHFQVDADFFDLSDPEKQKSEDEEKR